MPFLQVLVALWFHPACLLSVSQKRKKNIKDDERKSDVVRVNHEEERWGESSP